MVSIESLKRTAVGPKNLPAKNKSAELLGCSSGLSALKLGGLRQYSNQKAGRNEEKTDLQARSLGRQTKEKLNPEDRQTIENKQNHQVRNNVNKSNEQAENKQRCMQ